MRVRVAEIQAALTKHGLLTGVNGTLPTESTGISDDSRRVASGDLFVAVRGWNSDGHDFLDDAAARGASVAIVEDSARTSLPSLVVREGRRAAAIAAATAYGDPARKLTLLGVTGT
ncbi:MAG TPA: Mur ligase domain-containing protein, partial [Gemmatimonadaceae bacterium]|nr:Mur ligase domain-containing protein [Gemmatimonadaceae bacterium]